MHTAVALPARFVWFGANGGFLAEADKLHPLLRHAELLELVGVADLEAAWQIGQSYKDQDFSIVDRTSFAVMRRLGLERVASFDDDFAIFRYGPNRRRAFTVVR
ncbi:MAG: hypothetical protein FJW20_01385 [Acidimicrobiia bacterium]|nr:hypothetical protein [Acidimicrobiia bacterium]